MRAVLDALRRAACFLIAGLASGLLAFVLAVWLSTLVDVFEFGWRLARHLLHP